MRPGDGHATPYRQLRTRRQGKGTAHLTRPRRPEAERPERHLHGQSPLLAEHGATHGEPGHSLTGTTPLHARDAGQPEKPAYVYVTEVAHTLADGRPAVFGGGFYPRAHIGSALLPDSDQRLAVRDAPAENIDYYRLLDAPPPGRALTAGDTALLAFRTQIFVTRSTVAVVAGLTSGSPRLTGLYDAQGRAL